MKRKSKKKNLPTEYAPKIGAENVTEGKQKYYIAALDLEKCYDNVDTSLLYDLIHKLLCSDDDGNINSNSSDDNIINDSSKISKSNRNDSTDSRNNNIVNSKNEKSDNDRCSSSISSRNNSYQNNIDTSSNKYEKSDLKNNSATRLLPSLNEDYERDEEEEDEEEDEGYLVHRYSVSHYISR